MNITTAIGYCQVGYKIKRAEADEQEELCLVDDLLMNDSGNIVVLTAEDLASDDWELSIRKPPPLLSIKEPR